MSTTSKHLTFWTQTYGLDRRQARRARRREARRWTTLFANVTKEA